MKILSVTTAVVEANFDYVFVRVATDEGLSGTGESFFAPGITAMIRDFGVILEGQDPTNINRCLARLFALASSFGGSSGAGMAYNAISGIEAALWDLNGRLLGVPLVRLLGGTVIDSVPIYVDLHAGGELVSLDSSMRYRTPYWMSASGSTEIGDFYFEAAEPKAQDPMAWVMRAQQAVAQGFTQIKFDLDVFSEPRGAMDRSISRHDLLVLEKNVFTLREVIGDDIDIAFDCHWRFDVPTAIAIAHVIAPARPLWLEDPTSPDPASLAYVASRTSIPIATGENTYRVEGFELLISSGGVSILQPDFQKTGGLLEGLRIAELAARRGLPIAPHCIASPLGFMASAHVCAAVSNTLCLEFHGADVPFWSALVVGGKDLITDGLVVIPDRPGIGLDLDMEVVRAFAKHGEPFFDEIH